MAHRCFAFSLLVLGVWVSRAAAHAIGDASVQAKFEQWMTKYGRVYTDAGESERRFQIFKDNYEYIESINKAGNLTYRLGLNHFADMTNDEFESYNHFVDTSYDHPNSTTGSFFRYAYVSNLTESVNWITSGAVTNAKSQGSCGKIYLISNLDHGRGIGWN